MKKDAIEVAEQVKRSVTLSLNSKEINLKGTWSWDMQSHAVYCSDVMFFPEDFAGTIAIVHPDDLPKLTAAVSLMEEKDLVRLDFRIITTYGEVRTIAGQRVSREQPVQEMEEPVPGKEPWQEVLRQIALRKENDFLQTRSELTEYTERLHGIGSWLLNKETGDAWYSDNTFRIYNLAPQSLNAHANTFNPFIHKDDRVAVIDAFEKAFEEQAPLHIEYRIVTTEGETKYVQQITRWSYSVTGQRVLTAVIRDVTEERQHLDILSAAQSNASLYKQILALAEQKGTLAYWFTNLVTRKTTYSENYYRIYGFKQVALPNYNSFVNLVHVDDRQKVRELVDKMFNEHVLPETEFRIVRPDGKVRYVKQVGKVFLTENKELMMVGLVQDITVQKSLEKKISDFHENIAITHMTAEMTEQAAGITSFAWLPDGYMQWSDGFYRFLGYKPGSTEPLARTLYRNIHPDDLKLFRDTEALLLNCQDHGDIHIRFVSKGGIKQTRITFRRIDQTKEVIVALIRDISSEKERELQYLQTKHYAELITDSVTDLVVFTNIDHTIIHWNRVAEQMTGIRKEEALHCNLFEVLPELNESDFPGQLHLAVRGTEFHASKVSKCYLRKSHDYWLWPLKNEAGEVLGVLHVVRDTSKQLELQHQLSERLNFIESLVESSVDRIVVLDRFMNYLYWNKKAEEYYSISKERVIGKNILEVFPAFRNDPSYQHFRKVLGGETVYLPASVNEDTEEYFETYLVPVKGESGEVNAVLWIVHDLSREFQYQEEQEKARQLLSEEHRRLKEAQAVGHVGSFEWIAATDSIHWSEEMYRIYGLPVGEEISFEKLVSQIHVEDRSETLEKIKLCWAEPCKITFIHRIVRPEGDVRTVRRDIQSFPGDDGKVSHLAGTVQDITEQKKAEELLQQKDEQFRLFVTAGSDMVYKMSADWSEMYNLVGKDFLADTELRTNSWLEKYIPFDEQPRVIAAIRQAIESKTNFELEHRVIQADGNIGWAYSRAVPVQNERGEIVEWLGAASDITDRKKAEAALLQLKDALAQTVTDEYRTLFSTIDEGFAVCELMRNEEGKPMDYRFIELNPAFADHIKMRLEDAKSKLKNEVLPPDQDVVDMCAAVVALNQHVRKEFRSSVTGQWYDVSIYPRGGDRFVVIYENINERKTGEDKPKDIDT